MQHLTDYLLWVVLAVACLALASVLRQQKAAILAKLEELVQAAEVAVQGSGMGAEKKALVIARLRAMGVRVTAWVDKAIDKVVAQLNARRAWYRTRAAGYEDDGR